MGVASLWNLLRSQGLVTELKGSEGQHPDIVQLFSGKVIAIDLSIWIFQATNERNLQEHFGVQASCAKVAFERVSLQQRCLAALISVSLVPLK